MITFRTAFIGGLMASFGTYGIVADLELGIVIRCILRGDSSAITWIAIETLALCLLGMYVQNLRKGRTGDEESDEDADDIETNSNFK